VTEQAATAAIEQAACCVRPQFVTGSPRSPRPPNANKVTKLGKGKYGNVPVTI